jgi:ParB family chromosome partitioning protein
MAKKRLGIDALFVSTVVPEAETVAVRKLPLEKIIPNPNQPRRRIEASALNALVDSIRQSGVLQPIIVRELKDFPASATQHYQIVAGERRFQAARLAGLSEIPVIVRTLSDEESLQLALVENLQREDLNPVEETEGYLALLKLRLRTEAEFETFSKAEDIDPYSDVLRLLFAMNNNRKLQKEEVPSTRRVNNNVVIKLSEIVEQIFNSIGKTNWLSFVQHRLPLRRLPEDVLEALRAGKIEYTKARAIGRITSENLVCSESEALELRKSLLEKAISEALSLGVIKELIEEQTAKLAQEKKNKPNNQLKLKTLARETTKQLSKLRLNKLSKEHQTQLQEKLNELAQLVESINAV